MEEIAFKDNACLEGVSLQRWQAFDVLAIHSVIKNPMYRKD